MGNIQNIKEEEQDERFAGLSNAEIVFMYYRLKSYMHVLDTNLDKNVVSKQVNTPLGIATAIKEVKPEFVTQFKKTDYYKTACSLMEKLKPVVSVIEECDDSVKQLLKELK